MLPPVPYFLSVSMHVHIHVEVCAPHVPYALGNFTKHKTIEDSREREETFILFFCVCLCVHVCVTDACVYVYTCVKASLRCGSCGTIYLGFV